MLNKIAADIYHIFPMKGRYHEWLKTCNIVAFPERQKELDTRLLRVLASVIDSSFTPALMLHSLVEQAAGNQITLPTVQFTTFQ